jgi:hypothetical protein
MKLDSGTIPVVLASFVPLLVFLGAWFIERRAASHREKPPQQEKLLRPAGHSLGIRLEILQDRVLSVLLLACVLCSAGGVCALTLGLFLGHNVPFFWSMLALALFALFAGLGAWRVLRAFRSLDELRNVRLGLRGEQAVAEALHEAADAGYRIFHDLVEKQIGNIDHIAVGARGVFVIETKARRRRGSRNGKPEHVVAYDGKGLEFPCGYDSETIPQAERNAQWLSEFLSKRTAETVKVDAVVAIPGWYVETKGNFPVKVMNASYLVKYLRGQNAKLESAQVQRMVAALDDKCRDLEF